MCPVPGLRSAPGQNLGDGWQGSWSLGEPHHALTRLSTSVLPAQPGTVWSSSHPSMGDPPSQLCAVLALPEVVGLCLEGSRVGTTGSGERKAYWFKALSISNWDISISNWVDRGMGGAGRWELSKSSRWVRKLLTGSRDEPAPASPVAAPPLPAGCGVRGSFMSLPFIELGSFSRSFLSF